MAERQKLSTTTILIAASGWVVSVFLGLLELPAKVNSFFDEGPKAQQNITDWLLLDETYTGVWTSDLEGWVDATDEERSASLASGGPVTMRMRVYNGKVEGEIRTEGLAQSYIYSALLLEGEKRNGGIDLIAYDYIDGKKAPLALMRVSMGDQDERLPLHLLVEKQGGPFFPEEANLYRTSADVSEALAGGLNVDLLRRVIEEGKAEAESEQKK